MQSRLIAVLAATWAFNATAAVYVADPDIFLSELQSSPVINTAFAGVTLSAPGAGGDVLALGAGIPQVQGWAPASFGHRYLNQFQCGGCWFMDGSPLRADFAQAAGSVAFDFIDRWSGVAQVLAFSSNGELLDSASELMIGHSEPEDATRIRLVVNGGANRIAYILAGAEGTVYGVVDRLEWTVPEPTTGVLAWIGMIAAFAVRQRATSKLCRQYPVAPANADA